MSAQTSRAFQNDFVEANVLGELKSIPKTTVVWAPDARINGGQLAHQTKHVASSAWSGHAYVEWIERMG